MRLTLIPGGPDEMDYTASTVSLLVPTTNQRCSLCENRPPCWFVAPAVVSNTPDIGSTPLGGADACAYCLNDLIHDGKIVVSHVDPMSF